MLFITLTIRIQRMLTIAVVTGALLMYCGASYCAERPVNQNFHDSEIVLTQKAEDLLNQWSGQTAILDQVAQNLYFALKRNPNYAKAYMQLGRLDIMSGYYHSQYFEPSSLNAAERAIKKAIEIDPKFADAYVLLGHLYTNMNRLSEAKSALHTAEGIGTDSPWLGLNWAAIYEKEGKFDEAAQKYIQVIDSKTKNLKALGAAYDELRGYYIYKRDLVNAEKTYQSQIAVEPQNAWARGNYASNLLYDIGDFDKAIKKAREALSIMEYGNARHTLALALYGKWATITMKKRDKSSAQQYFDEAQRNYPDLTQLQLEAMQYPTTKIIVEALASIQTKPLIGNRHGAIPSI